MDYKNFDYEKEALVFFNRYTSLIDNDRNQPIDFEGKAFEFVKRNPRFIFYRDKVEGDTLIGVLEKLGLLKFKERNNNIRYHLLTEKGVEYLNKIRNNQD